MEPPPLFKIPKEVLGLILKHLCKESLLKLSLTCSFLKSNATLLKAIYEEPFPKEFESYSRNTFDYVAHHEIFDIIMQNINSETGHFVRRVALHSWNSSNDLEKLSRLCPNLDEADFTEVHDYDDYVISASEFDNEEYTESGSEFDEDEFLNCIIRTSHNNFHWRIILRENLPFFQRLKAIKARFEDGVIPFHNENENEEDLANLLQVCPNLERLELEESSASISGQRAIQRFILNDGGAKLRTLGVVNKLPLRIDFGLFLRPLKKFNTPMTFRLSLSHDLAATHRRRIWDSQEPTIFEYIIGAKAAVDQGWKLSITDLAEQHPSIPNSYFGSTSPRILPYLQWLVRSCGWSPVFTWEQVLRLINGGGTMNQMPSVERIIDADLALCRQLFQSFQNLGVPIRLLLTPCPSEYSFFCYEKWARGRQMYEIDASDPVDPEEKPELIKTHFSYHKPDGSDQRLWGWTHLASWYSKNKHQDSRSWGLASIGDLVHDLRLIWKDDICFVNPNHYLPDRLTPDEEIQYLQLKLSHEAERLAPLFRNLSLDFPHLKRLALYIPAALYPDCDGVFVEKILPGNGWTVRHCGSGGGNEAWPKNMAYAPGGDFIDWPISSTSFQYRTWKARCPMIHRVFVRTIGVKKNMNLDDEVYMTKRPAIDVQDPDMMELIGRDLNDDDLML